MKIQRKKGKFIFEINEKTPRFNPYDESEEGDMDTLIGLISKNQWKQEEFGFAHRIDMAYKDKDDQVGEYIILWPGTKETFLKACEELKIDIIDYTTPSPI